MEFLPGGDLYSILDPHFHIAPNKALVSDDGGHLGEGEDLILIEPEVWEGEDFDFLFLFLFLFCFCFCFCFLFFVFCFLFFVFVIILFLILFLNSLFFRILKRLRIRWWLKRKGEDFE